MGDLQAVDPLIEALKDAPLVQRRVVWALGELSDPVAIEPLLHALAFASDRAIEEEILAAVSKLGVSRAQAIDRARDRGLDRGERDSWNEARETYRVDLTREGVRAARAHEEPVRGRGGKRSARR